MALADILSKIEGDARAEAARIIEAAEQRVAVIAADAESRAAEHRVAALAESETEAEREAARVVVSARIEARDAGLAQRRELVDEVLAAAAERLAASSDRDYATFLARRVSRVASDGETLRLGSADAERAEAVVEALRVLAPGTVLRLASEPAAFERGALVEGDRVRADLSLDAILEEDRDELELLVASELFAREG